MDPTLPLSFVSSFVAGAFFCNSLPHLVCGLTGRAFPTPFARPRGVGRSSAVANFLWGFVNLVLGWALVAWRPFRLGPDTRWLTFGLGVLLLGLYLAWRFGRLAAKRQGIVSARPVELYLALQIIY